MMGGLSGEDLVFYYRRKVYHLSSSSLGLCNMQKAFIFFFFKPEPLPSFILCCYLVIVNLLYIVFITLNQITSTAVWSGVGGKPK